MLIVCQHLAARLSMLLMLGMSLFKSAVIKFEDWIIDAFSQGTFTNDTYNKHWAEVLTYKSLSASPL